MGYMEMLKNYFGNTKTSNLYQNPDLVEELGYAKPADPTPPNKEQNDKPVPDATAPDAKTPPIKKPDSGVASTRG